MEAFLSEVITMQQQWAQRMVAEQHQFFERFLNRGASPVSSLASVSVAVPKFHNFDDEQNDFDTYKRQLEEHFKAYGVEDNDKKRSFFLSWVGDKTFHLLQKLIGKNILQNASYTELISNLDDHYKTKIHVIKSRYEFYKREKHEGETYNQWVMELRGKARECNFICKNNNCNSEYVDQLIRDIVILYTPDEPVRTAALHKDDPSLQEVLQIAETFEATQKTLETLKNKNQLDNEIYTVKPSYSQHYKNRQNNQDKNEKYQKKPLPACNNCFKTHEKKDCKFLKAQCFKCKRKGHIASVCKSIPISNVEVESIDSDVTNCNVIDEIIKRCGNKMLIDIQLNDQLVQFQFDTGAGRSIIGLNTYKTLRNVHLTPSTIKLHAYGNSEIPVLGSCRVYVKIREEAKVLDVIVANSEHCNNIFGLNWYDEFKSVQIFRIEENLKIKSICNDFKELFSKELGRCNVMQAHIYMKSDVRPKFFKPRPIPYAIVDTFKEEAERLTKLGIWKPVKFSQWASPLVIVPKSNNKIRICADFKVTINPQMDVEQYPIPRIRDLFHKLKNGKLFSKIDLSDAYLQIEVDEESKNLLVVNTPLGLYQYQRLPFGVASAPAIFQRLIEQTISGIPGCVNYLDDIICTGSNDEDHINNLKLLLTRLYDSGFRCNFEKCSFMQPKIEYLGHIISFSGIQQSENRTEAISKLPRPRNIAELQSFLGKVNYYASFIKNFSTICGPLNLLRKKNQSFFWGKEQENSFQELKHQLVEMTQLAHFDETLPIVLATDASSYGVGAVISHIYPDGSERPIAFASKTLNENKDKSFSEELLPYYRHRNSLTFNGDVIILQNNYNRVVIPKHLRKRIIQLLHQGHWGIVRMKQIARRYCWWPKIDDDIAKLVSSCQACYSHSTNPPKQFSPWPKATLPWQRIHLDYAGPFEKNMWLIVVDSFSQFPYVIKMENTTTISTIKALQNIFSIEGLPETIVTDNGTQFTSNDFKVFCQVHGIEHLTTAPFHPSSNGNAERFVRTFKTSIKKQLTDGSSLQASVLAYITTYRTSPNSCGKSPAELLHGRQPRTLLSLLSPTSTHTSCSDTLKPPIKINDNVLCRNFWEGDKWIPGKIIKTIGNMMFLIDVGNKVWKRHINQIRLNKSLNNSNFKNVSQLALSLLESVQPSQQSPQTFENIGNSQNQSDEVNNPRALMDENPSESIPETPLAIAEPQPRKSSRIKKKPDRYSP
ncbi:uncharacterized protein K02A2.6-like [Lucilia sericata]|uniref:uncharacterized protein K02A2.6-like n=1 Tax=Lucilia sericata TaxID=13632 RepID=UPI0018A87965|nr:uncharacterized protein K02A2.6-like [Lucilia sericata]